LFPRVTPYFLYWVKGLEFQEQTLRAAERRYGLSIMRVPHAYLAAYYKRSDFRHDLPSNEMRASRLSVTDQENALRVETGINWLITGKKRADSLWRRGELAAPAKTYGIDDKRRNIFPLIDWTDPDVWSYLKFARIPAPPEYRVFAGIAPRSLSWDLNSHKQGRYLLRIRDAWPDDYARILNKFPLAAALVAREEMYGGVEADEAKARRMAGVAKRKLSRKNAISETSVERP
jgi:phosphoadenosine phosphosulfate reductase